MFNVCFSENNEIPKLNEGFQRSRKKSFYQLFFRTIGVLYVTCIVMMLQVYISRKVPGKTLCPSTEAEHSSSVLSTVVATSQEFSTQSLFEVCVVTARRPDNVSYVTRNLASLVVQGVDSRDVTVVDVDASSWAFLGFFVGVKLPDVRDVRRMADCVDDGNDVKTGVPCPVMQSNYDMSMALTVCWEAARVVGKEWLLFIEDDVVACEGSMQKIRRRLEEISGKAGVSMIRFSKGAMGYALRAKYVLDLVTDIRMQASVKPHDFIVENGDWGGGAKQLVFAENLFHHIGEISSIPYRNKADYVNAYGEQRKDVCGQRL